MDSFQAPQPAAVKPIARRKPKRNSIIPVIFLILLFIVLVLWMNFPIARHYLKMDPPTLTTSLTPTL